ncbi:MAG TPA: glycoside hydrolase family 16 protein [Devosia sp.]|nr:glycoside hydrolase family 16 protein [Devosia sp.]
MHWRQMALAIALTTLALPAQAATLQFAGYSWDVRDYGGLPGPNSWDGDNVFVDAAGLHLRIVKSGDTWNASEVVMTAPLGFGTYRFEIAGRPDRLDRNVVLGLFNFPASDAVVPAGTNEIDVEVSQWGDAGDPNRLNWTVQPSVPGLKSTHKGLPLRLKSDRSTYRFTWSATGVTYDWFPGYPDAAARPAATWIDAPAEPAKHIPQSPLVVHMNLWLIGGKPPHDGKPVEIVITSFSFTPAP